ncbi:MAG: carbon-nitrogen hydrolase family protein [Campylobacteraceae bacterium]|jgi:nitrilase|nr:carbon-nitrogen hydrolase family protein [Campylobacteraceae bacterium]
MNIKVAAIQLQTLPMSNARLDHYIIQCCKSGANLIVLGEYVLNSFFKELEKIPASMIKEQSERRVEVIKEFAKKYNVTIIAPIILHKNGKLYKSIMRAAPNISCFYEQKILINYKYWNEDKFFANNAKNISIPVFMHEGLKVGIISGFEAHFDLFWQQAVKKGVDLILMPSVSTFESSARWHELLKTRAFLNSVYILRASRIGSFKDKTHSWYFYGDTALYSPGGILEDSLGEKEGMLVGMIESGLAAEARKICGFKNQLARRKLL